MFGRPISFRSARRYTRMHEPLLTGKRAVIYGGGGAIGAGVAAAFAREGAHVHLIGRTRDRLERAAAAIVAAGEPAGGDRPRVEIGVLDAFDEAAVQAHLGSLPRVDISLNLVTRGDVQGQPLAELTVDQVMAPIENIRSNLITARAAARRMIDQGEGVILWLTSGSAAGAAPGMGGTGPADAATDNYMRQLARETGRQGLRVCGIWTAGVYDTFLGADGDPTTPARSSGVTATQIDRLIGNMAALGRAPRLEQVAEAAVFLASERAACTTGSVLNVTCGLVSER